MSHYGIIFTALQCEDMIERSLAPWIAARKEQLRGDKFTICAVSVPFEGFPQEETPDRTRAILGMHVQAGDIDHAIVRDKPMRETEARGAALKWLVEQEVDALVQWDADEITTLEDIGRMLAFIETNPWIDWFRLSLRNAVFTPTTFLAEPFTPPRVHRVKSRNAGSAIHFWDDNNIAYSGGITRRVVRDIDMASMTIPAVVINPVHLTWIDDGPNGRSRRKQEYQRRRWGHCSFKWNEVTNRLEWDEAYYAKQGLPLPEVIHD